MPPPFLLPNYGICLKRSARLWKALAAAMAHSALSRKRLFIARKHLIAAARRLGIGVHDAASMEPRGAVGFPLSTVSAWMLNGKSLRRFCAHRCDAVARRGFLRSSFSARLTLGRL